MSKISKDTGIDNYSNLPVGRHVKAVGALVELLGAEQLQEVPVRSRVVLEVAPQLDVDEVCFGPADVHHVPVDDEARRRGDVVPVVDVGHLHFGWVSDRVDWKKRRGRNQRCVIAYFF